MIKTLKYTLLSLTIVTQSYAVSWNQSQSIYSRLSSGSGPQLVHDPRNIFNAMNTGSTIIVFNGLMKRVGTNEMAFVLGHELGHSHGNGSGWAGEFGSDRYGVGLANSRGFNGCAGAKSFLRKIGDPASRTHPSSAERIKRLPC